MNALQNHNRRKPDLKEVLEELGPMPGEAVLMGIADDGGPVWYNTNDVTSPNMLVWGGKIEFVQLIAQYIILNQLGVRRSTDIEFVVLTSDPTKWEPITRMLYDRKHSPCVGIVPIYSTVADEILISLDGWVRRGNPAKQSLLVLVDDMEKLLDMDFEAKQNFQSIVNKGPEYKVFTIGIVQAELSFRWNKGFQMDVRYNQGSGLYEMHNHWQGTYEFLQISLPELVTI